MSRRNGGGSAPGPAAVAVEAALPEPGGFDAHTHLVFAGDRSAEFNSRLAGKPYEAGGILSTVAATRAASAEELTAGVVERADKCLHGGTTTIEVKSGYGLDLETVPSDGDRLHERSFPKSATCQRIAL